MPTPRITFRLSDRVSSKIADYIEGLRHTRPYWGEYNMTDFIRDAIDEKLAHLERSRKAAVRRRKPRAEGKILPPLSPEDHPSQCQPTVEEACWGVNA